MRAALLALALAGLTACGGASRPEDGEPPLYRYKSMEAAVDEARASLPVFWDAFNSGDAAYSDFALNVITPSKRYTAEHVWVVDIREAGGRYHGTITKDHEMDDGFASGDEVDFLPGQIADWRYKEGGRFRGAYTSRAMLDLAPGADTGNIRALFHDSPVP
ncbi:MAG TPA: DUF2314 domain-containing protein [Hyphomonas sp.]|nr:DUF2314 domain-containing protein [Hyphomonas sp.]MCA8905889.1 DUF2314 domain-containing protein [Hyphomonas sp.]MCB9962317.1 DUF2314 domain-containing protein [Hyphomonas sp.]MCB9972828.1 DUF2314 domain-containing protein [Hyphomonas sp.]HPE47514.1 DUF2314 domain-containing protein [Hyphomonas sp.]